VRPLDVERLAVEDALHRGEDPRIVEGPQVQADERLHLRAQQADEREIAVGEPKTPIEREDSNRRLLEERAVPRLRLFERAIALPLAAHARGCRSGRRNARLAHLVPAPGPTPPPGAPCPTRRVRDAPRAEKQQRRGLLS